jgi:hypothetical protein
MTILLSYGLSRNRTVVYGKLSKLQKRKSRSNVVCCASVWTEVIRCFGATMQTGIALGFDVDEHTEACVLSKKQTITEGD